MTIPRFRRAAAAMALSAMALTTALTTSPASAAPTSSAEAGVVDVTDTAVLTVLHNSKKLTSTEATQKQLAAEKANKEALSVAA
ncbi:hypothetical protein [Kineococcus sp. NPDC059986]|uniref:hypothetical protein n=1 Tax=Kineococcus sp. NPDC059986 TaxID=3155538 RepID=UPI00345103B8